MHDSLGDAWKASGRLKEAAECYARAVRRGEEIGDPNLPAYRNNLADATTRLAAVAAAKEGSEQTMVAVASYHNPSLSVEGATAEERLFALLTEAKIDHVSAGSAGFSLNVFAADAARARAIVAKAIEEEGLAATLVPAALGGG